MYADVPSITKLPDLSYGHSTEQSSGNIAILLRRPLAKNCKLHWMPGMLELHSEHWCRGRILPLIRVIVFTGNWARGVLQRRVYHNLAQ